MNAKTARKIESEKERVRYTFKLYISYLIAALILVVLTNIVVKIKGFPDAGWFAADEGSWIAFYGTLIGGFITLLGVNQTIRFTQAEDRRLQAIEDEENEKKEDLQLIRHLWDLEAGYQQLSKELHRTIVKLDELHEPSVVKIEQILMQFQQSIRHFDFISLSAKIDWETYDLVNQQLGKVRQIILLAETDLYDQHSAEDIDLLKIRLIDALRKEKIDIDQRDDTFEQKRALLEEKHLKNNSHNYSKS